MCSRAVFALSDCTYNPWMIIQAFFLRNICVQCVTRAVRCVEWCIAGSVSLEVTSGSVSDGKKVVRVRIGYVSVQLRWIVTSQELGSEETRVIAVGFLDPPFLVTVCLFVLIYACKFYINVKRKIWVPCLEEELASCVVLVFVFHDTLWDQNPNWWMGLLG